MPFIGTTPTQGFVSSFPKQSFTPNGSTTVFTLTNPVASANDLEVFVGNVRQEPTTAYTAAGTTLTMSEAPDAGLNFYVINKSFAQVTTTPPANSISTDKIVNSAVTNAKIGGMAASKLTGAMPALDGSALTGISGGKVLQVVQTVKTNTTTYSSSGYASFGLDVTITPSATTSKVFLLAQVSLGHDTASANVNFRWYNGSSAVGTDPFYIERWPSDTQAVYRTKALTFNYLDSPSTTSAITYGLQFSRNAGAALINMAGNTGGGVNNLTSTIHAIEIGA